MAKVSSKKMKQTLCRSWKLCFMWICLMAPPTFLTSVSYLSQKHQPWECAYCFLHISSAAMYGAYLVNSAVKTAWGEGCAFVCKSFSPINKHALPRALPSSVSFVRECFTFMLDCLSFPLVSLRLCRQAFVHPPKHFRLECKHFLGYYGKYE